VAIELSSRQRRKLKALAHPLQPTVHVGKAGITDAVVASVDRALLDHELIKVQMREPEDKKAMAQHLAEATAAALCGLLGHTVILYRPHPDTPTIALD
jgi:RNA-binding protein